MGRSTNAASRARPEETYRFVDRALFWLESATIAVLLLITLAQPTTSLVVGLPTWGLVVLFAVYSLLADLVQNRVHSLRSLAWNYVANLPVTGLLYFLGGEAGGPLFVLFILSVDCAAASMTLRGTLLYAAAAAAMVAAIDLALLLGPLDVGDVRALVTRLLVLALIGAGMAIVIRRLRLEQQEARSVRDEAERLEELDRARSDFVSNVSHELRTPLTAARAGLGMLDASAHERLRPDERALVDNARRNVERLAEQIVDLLAYNQLEAGTLRPEREPLDLRAVVKEAVSAVRPLIGQKGQALELDLPEPLPTKGDPRRLEQAVANLLSNAHRHTPSGTHVTVHGRVDGDEVLLCVSDDGPGIPAGEQETIFRRFYRLRPESGGSGLGLAIVKAIVELHGGSIRAESRPGEGATFRVALPRRRDGGGDER
jgi:signal transduction histidine kinase